MNSSYGQRLLRESSGKDLNLIVTFLFIKKTMASKTLEGLFPYLLQFVLSWKLKTNVVGCRATCRMLFYLQATKVN